MKNIYYKRLDYIRAISCILILLYHLNIVKGGYLAVCTFFTLSGYLGCTSALKNENFSLKKYYINRFKKIYIPLIIVVSLTIIIVKQIPTINWINLKQETTSVIFGYNNFWQLSANLDYFTRHINSPFMHLWYISILMQYELIFPLVYLFIKKIKKHASTILILLLLIISIIFFYHMSKTEEIMQVYYNTFARSFSLIFGIFLALIHYNNIKISRAFSYYTKIIFLLYNIILITISICVSGSSKNYAIFMILTTIVSTRLIEYATNKTDEEVFKPLKFISNISYEIYLVQYPVIFFITSLLKENPMKIPIIIIVTIIISYIINKVTYLKGNKLINTFKILIIILIISVGGFIYIKEKDGAAEMKQLEKELAENRKNIEKRNKEYMNKSNEENEKWKKKLESMENEEAKVAEIVKNLNVVGVGDSVFLDAINELYARFPNGYFDGKISRTIYGAEDLLKDLKSKGKLSDTLIFCLATNGDYSDKRSKELMDIVEDRTVYWVNAFGADDPSFNDKFKAFAKDYPNIHFVPWDEEGAKHPEYFWADKIHVKGPGMTAYADLIYQTIYNDYLKKNNIKKDEIIQNHEKEINNKVVFFGNEALTNSYNLINKKFKNAIINVKNYNFKNLYKELEEKINSQTLNHKIVFILDEKAKITEEEYKKISELCKDYEIYICNITKNKYNIENVKVIDFYKEIKKNKKYLTDGKHLSKQGNKALIDTIYNEIKARN